MINDQAGGQMTPTQTPHVIINGAFQMSLTAAEISSLLFFFTLLPLIFLQNKIEFDFF